MNKVLVGTVMLATTALLSGCPWDRGGGGGSPATTYTIGGTVTGLTASGLVLQLNGANNIAVATGATSFASSSVLTSGAAYAVTVSAQPATQTCSVTNGTGTVASANVTNVAVSCVTNSYTVGATVTGLVGTGLVLQLNGAGNLSVAPSTTGLQIFSNRVDTGAAYAVTVLSQPAAPIQQCDVTNGSGMIAGTNVTNVSVTCVNVTTFSGVAAVGSPLAGTVSVKDANGTIRTTPLGSNGGYTIDVNGLTAPFVFRAEGRANGHSYVVHSAAVAADVGGTINITQLTDLVVDNIAGQVASAYYDAGNFSALTPTALNAEVAMLKSRLLPVLMALGVDASIDLLRSRFTPLMSALDDALDILRVSVDATTNMATILNIVTQQSIQDAINVPAAAESNPSQLDNISNLGSVVSDSDAIRTALANFAGLFATGLPSTANIEAMMTADFLDNDTDRASTAAELATASSFIGGSIVDVDITNIDYSDLTQVTATVDFVYRDRNGIDEDSEPNYRIRKGTDNVWRLHGDQRVIEAGGNVHLYRANGCTLTGLEFDIEDNNSANNGGVINHVNVYGPGLPASGLRFAPSASGGGRWVYTNVPNQPNSSYYRMANSCITGGQVVSDAGIAAIPDNAGYVFAAYASVNDTARINFPSGAISSGPYAGMYSLNIEKRPLTLTEAVLSTQFPTITAPNSAVLSSYSSGALSISATGFAPNTPADFILEQNTASGNFRGVDDEVMASASGTASTTLSLTAPAAGDTITNRSVRVATHDVYGRTFMSGIDINAPTYSVSGTVSGLTGTLGLILYSGVTPNPFTVQAGATTFTGPIGLANGTAFGVAIASQPVGQTCIVTRSSGGIANSNVTGVIVNCVANATSPLAGTFIGTELSEGIYIVLTLAPDGRYVLAMRHPDVVNCRNSAGQLNSNIIEYGVYNWNANTGAFRAVMAAVDPTDDCGFNHAGFPPFSATVVRNGNALNFSYTADSGNPAAFTLTAATNTTGQLLGSYELPNGRVITLLGDGTYLSTLPQERPNGVAANTFTIGFEHGCYTSTATALTIDLSGTCQPSGFPAVDTNGPFLLSVNGQARTIPYEIIDTANGDVLNLFNTTTPIYYTRIQSN